MTAEERPLLDDIETRVLGVLVEKQMTTPDVYPLSLGAVVAGCNQSTNREPVMSVEESEVEKALVRLHDAALATPVRRSGDRVTKYRHKLAEALELDDRAAAVLAVLMLRGPQTAGELRSRTERYVTMAVDEVDAVVETLEEMRLAERLARLPGQSQRRVRHLLGSGEPGERSLAEVSSLEERVAAVEARLRELLDRLGIDDL